MVVGSVFVVVYVVVFVWIEDFCGDVEVVCVVGKFMFIFYGMKDNIFLIDVIVCWFY